MFVSAPNEFRSDYTILLAFLKLPEMLLQLSDLRFVPSSTGFDPGDGTFLLFMLTNSFSALCYLFMYLTLEMTSSFSLSSIF